ncbi:MAG: Coenzyme PQQ synthesis protein E [candidate division WS2 bacterium]|nr:Coenzyme PQQ synthesis protein E [Candidatus Psychracetigena formicireducens]
MDFLKEKMEDGFVLLKRDISLKKVYIEVTSRCNLSCITCIRNVWLDPMEDMDLETFIGIIEQLKGFKSVNEIVFGGYGEPLYHPQILQMLEKTKMEGFKTTITTNGVLLDKKTASILVNLNLDQIVVSFDSAQPQQYGSIRIGASLVNVVANINSLNEEKLKKKSHLPKIGIEFVVMKRNYQEIPAMTMLATRTLGASFVKVTNILPHTEEMTKEVLYGGQHELSLTPTWPVFMGEWLQWGSMELPRMKWGALRQCRFLLSDAVVISVDGKVSPCYPLLHSYPYYIFGRKKEVKKHSFGNVKEKKLINILNADEFLRFRYRVRNFDFPSCVDCELNSNCEYASSNTDCWGGDPSCADCLFAQDIVRCP